MTTPAADLIATFQRRPLDRARRLAGIRSLDEMRAYLAETGSPYAGHADDGMVRAAFLGAVLFALEDLARSYEQEIARHA